MTCDKCGKARHSQSLETVVIHTARQTHSSPAEYEEQSWCSSCRERAEYESDPSNEAYERARANGWAD